MLNVFIILNIYLVSFPLKSVKWNQERQLSYSSDLEKEVLS